MGFLLANGYFRPGRRLFSYGYTLFHNFHQAGENMVLVGGASFELVRSLGQALNGAGMALQMLGVLGDGAGKL